jgi:PTH2 family peptidyl-tRNA hydrolase
MSSSESTYKLTLLIRSDLKMDKGKVAAQCSHATLGAYRLSAKYNASITNSWEKDGEAKITLKIESEDQMMELVEKSRKLGLITYIVHDAGRTQVEPGSKTVLAIGPDHVEKINKITQGLKLY